MELKDIQNLIKFIVKSGAAEIYFKDENIEINVKNIAEGQMHFQPQITPQMFPAATASTSDAANEIISGFSNRPTDNSTQDESKYVTIKSPMIGTFYRKPGPDKANFVNVGDSIKEGTVVCIIEAMKLFNEIESEVSGKVVKILVEDSSPVEYDQPLFLVDPS